MEDFERRSLLRYYPADSPEFAAAAARVDAGEPLAYVTGEQYFYGERYRLNSACLIPRPDTECVLEELLRHLKRGTRFADLCCGSGCIGISALCHSEETSALGVDISPLALEAARENAAQNGVAERYETRCADLLAPDFESGERFPAVVANPPYIKRSVIPSLGREIAHEPVIALDGGEDGLVFYRALLSRFEALVAPGGVMILETGYDQGESLRALCGELSLSCIIKKDYGGNDRIAVVQYKN